MTYLKPGWPAFILHKTPNIRIMSKKVEFKFIRPKGMTSTEWGKVTGAAYDIFAQNTPIRTGNLRSSINVNVTNRSIKGNYGSIAPYAEFLEFGTPKMAARDMTGKTVRDLDIFCRDIKDSK